MDGISDKNVQLQVQVIDEIKWRSRRCHSALAPCVTFAPSRLTEMSSDTPFPSFLSSGALSRAYYTLVRKTESSSSIQQADQYLLDEINSIRVRLSHPALTLVSTTGIMLNPRETDSCRCYTDPMQGMLGCTSILLHVDHFWYPRKWCNGLCVIPCGQSSRGWEDGAR